MNNYIMIKVAVWMLSVEIPIKLIMSQECIESIGYYAPSSMSRESSLSSLLLFFPLLKLSHLISVNFIIMFTISISSPPPLFSSFISFIWFARHTGTRSIWKYIHETVPPMLWIPHQLGKIYVLIQFSLFKFDFQLQISLYLWKLIS